MPNDTGADGTGGDGSHGAASGSAAGNFEGIQILIATPEVEAHINRFFPLGKLFTRPTPPASNWLSLPDEQAIEQPQLNTLYFPMGLTRWAYGAFLISGRHLNRLEAAVAQAASGAATYLELGDSSDADHFVRARLSPLCPIPISGSAGTTAADGAYPLYLLPLVDARYLAQSKTFLRQLGSFYSGAPPFVGTGVESQTYCDFREYVSDYDDTSIEPTGGLPDYFGLLEQSCFVAEGVHSAVSGTQAVEAALWSCGLTFVPEVDGSNARNMDKSDGESRLAAFNGKLQDRSFRVISGYAPGAPNSDNVSRLAASGVPVMFRLQYAGVEREQRREATYYPETRQVMVTASEAGSVAGGSNGGVWDVIAPIFVPLDRDNNGDVLDTFEDGMNDLEALALALAETWYALVDNPIDVTLSGICDVPVSPHTDVVCWSLTRRGPQTRVRSRRWNTFPTRLCNQLSNFGGDEGLGDFEYAVVETPAEGDEGTVTINSVSHPAFYPELGDGYGPFVEGDRVIVGWDFKTQKWYVTNHPPLDFDKIYDEVKQRLQDNGDLGDNLGP